MARTVSECDEDAGGPQREAGADPAEVFPPPPAAENDGGDSLNIFRLSGAELSSVQRKLANG